MADLLTQVRRDIVSRLTELRPVLDEVRRLELAREALSPSNGGQSRHRARRPRSTANRARMTRAKSQEIDQRVLALLSADSKQKPAALALLTETSAASMNSRLNRLVKAGAVKKRKGRAGTRYEVQTSARKRVA